MVMEETRSRLRVALGGFWWSRALGFGFEMLRLRCVAVRGLAFKSKRGRVKSLRSTGLRITLGVLRVLQSFFVLSALHRVQDSSLMPALRHGSFCRVSEYEARGSSFRLK